MAKNWCIGIIGGSGLYDIEGIEDAQWLAIETPWGDPSDEILFGRIGDVQVRFLPRQLFGSGVGELGAGLVQPLPGAEEEQAEHAEEECQ